MKALTIWGFLRGDVQRSIYRKMLLSFFFQDFVLMLGTDPAAYSDYSGKFNQFAQVNPIVAEIVVSHLDGFSFRAGSLTTVTSQEESDRLKELAIKEEGKGVWLPSHTYDRQSQAHRHPAEGAQLRAQSDRIRQLQR